MENHCATCKDTNGPSVSVSNTEIIATTKGWRKAFLKILIAPIIGSITLVLMYKMGLPSEPLAAATLAAFLVSQAGSN